MSGWTDEPDYLVADEARVGLSRDRRFLAIRVEGELFASDEGTGMRASWVVALTPQMAEELVEMVLDILGAPQ